MKRLRRALVLLAVGFLIAVPFLVPHYLYADGNAGGQSTSTGDSTAVAGFGSARESNSAGVKSISPNNAFQYVYLDSSVLGQGDTQYIAIALKDEKAGVSSARLTLKASKTGSLITLDSNKIVGNTVLFAFVTNDQTPTDTYIIQSVNYKINSSDKSYIAEFAGVSSKVGDYRFDIVTPKLAQQLSSAPVDANGVSAYTIDEDGNLKGASSVDDAVAAADAAGTESSFSDATAVTGVNSNPRMRSAVNSTRENYLIVAVNAGHGGDDSGAVGYGLQEKNLTLNIANSLVNELNTYTGVSPVMTRVNDNQYVTGAYLPARNGSVTTAQDLQTRVDIAKSLGADVYVSVHINSTGTGVAYGAEVWVPNSSQYIVPDAHRIGEELGNKILSHLEALGLYNRGTKVRSTVEDTYPDGSLEDWYGDIRKARLAGMPGIIVEHAFIDNSSDAAKLSDPNFQRQLGIADATGIAQQYNLGRDSDARAVASVEVSGHIANLGWERPVYDNKVAGTTGKGIGLQAYKVSALNGVASSGGIRYTALVNNNWQDWKSDGAVSGTVGKGVALQAVKIELTGDAAAKYDIYYRVHSANVGWLDWAKNGAPAGTQGYDRRAEALQVCLVSKNSDAPGPTNNAFRVPLITYRAHVQNIGWQGDATDGGLAGTTGQNLHMEALSASLGAGVSVSGGVEVNAHVQNIGWQGFTSNVAGTTGRNLAIEAVRIRLTGEAAAKYDIYYRVHSANVGWLAWAKNGASAGTQGYSLSAQAIRIVLVKKGDKGPDSGNQGVAFRSKSDYSIMGKTTVSASRMVSAYWQHVSSYPDVYKDRGAATIDDFVNACLQAANDEGVRGEVLFAQAMKETAWLKFGGQVKPEQCNFAGLGATNNGAAGATFKDVYTGFLAQAQHLKAYATTAKLNKEKVDPRFDLVTRGVAPTLELLDGRWAVPGNGYGDSIVSIVQSM